MPSRFKPGLAQYSVSPPELVEQVYAELAMRLEAAHHRWPRPRTLTEKLILGHLAEVGDLPARGEGYVDCLPDRIAMPDCGAQMALLRLMTLGDWDVTVPTTVHCDTMIVARQDAKADLLNAGTQHREIYDFLRTAAARFGLGFWEPGTGIHHQVLLENYAFPGGFLVANNSHTPNAGGLGMLAIGMGGADVVDAMTDRPVSFRMPRLIGVHLQGELEGWASPKDVILELAARLTVRGATGAVIEYLGPGAASLSATGKATICNMGAELGATTSLFGLDASMTRYLEVLGRGTTAELAREHAELLTSDPAVLEDPTSFYDQVIEIDLRDIAPSVAGPASPDRVRPVGELPSEAGRNGYPAVWSQALVGSCTNSSYEDIGRAAHVARQIRDAGQRARVPLAVTPGSESILRAVRRDGLLADLTAIGATVYANACGPCFGQWERSDTDADTTNAIITSYNRNFPGRNDGSRRTLAFVASPEVVVAASVAGRLDVDPTMFELVPGRPLVPPHASTLPEHGWISSQEGFLAPPIGTARPRVEISVGSQRLATLDPFPAEPVGSYERLHLLVKIAGTCTTDDISPAGPWLRFRGHLDRMADNTLSGATNAFTGRIGFTTDQGTGEQAPISEVARRYREAGIAWVVVGDENFGEGSSREHAAMQLRHLGGLVVITRSFARIHEENLKKNGILALTFRDPADFDRVREDNRISVLNVPDIREGSPVILRVAQSDGSHHDMVADHSMNGEQITWFHAGSALNTVMTS